MTRVRSRGFGWPELLLVLALICCLSMQVWPGYARFGARIEPLVLGLPFAFFWAVLWVLVSFSVVLIYHLLRGEKR